ncbi:hypothetical protein HK102_008402, partial [Quaeritorhiza haematococci]
MDVHGPSSPMASHAPGLSVFTSSLHLRDMRAPASAAPTISLDHASGGGFENVVNTADAVYASRRRPSIFSPGPLSAVEFRSPFADVVDGPAYLTPGPASASLPSSTPPGFPMRSSIHEHHHSNHNNTGGVGNTSNNGGRPNSLHGRGKRMNPNGALTLQLPSLVTPTTPSSPMRLETPNDALISQFFPADRPIPTTPIVGSHPPTTPLGGNANERLTKIMTSNLSLHSPVLHQPPSPRLSHDRRRAVSMDAAIKSFAGHGAGGMTLRATPARTSLMVREEINELDANSKDGAQDADGKKAGERENKKLNLYKTELCRSWEETGTCRYGSKCQFAHSVAELRHVERHPKYKTEMCKTFWEKGTCPYGKRCCFIHTERDALGRTAAEVEKAKYEAARAGAAATDVRTTIGSPKRNISPSMLRIQSTSLDTAVFDKTKGAPQLWSPATAVPPQTPFSGVFPTDEQLLSDAAYSNFQPGSLNSNTGSQTGVQLPAPQSPYLGGTPRGADEERMHHLEQLLRSVSISSPTETTFPVNSFPLVTGSSTSSSVAPGSPPRLSNSSDDVLSDYSSSPSPSSSRNSSAGSNNGGNENGTNTHPNNPTNNINSHGSSVSVTTSSSSPLTSTASMAAIRVTTVSMYPSPAPSDTTHFAASAANNTDQQQQHAYHQHQQLHQQLQHHQPPTPILTSPPVSQSRSSTPTSSIMGFGSAPSTPLSIITTTNPTSTSNNNNSHHTIPSTSAAMGPQTSL